MKETFIKKIGLFVLALILVQASYAQVTIGSAEVPVTGALLQLKNKTGITGGNDNATKGLGLPRVALVAIDDLAPAATSPADNAAHTGLTVYNMTDNSATISTLKEGVYTWDGVTWQPVGLKGVQGFGPWYQVADPTLPSRMVDTDSYLSGKATLGGAFATPEGAAISVQTQADDNPTQGGVNSTKGFMMPRVLLTASSSLEPFVVGGGTADEKVSHKGMTVYHIGGNGINAGQRIWDGGVWLQVLTDIPPTPINAVSILALQTPIISLPASGVTSSLGKSLSFGNLDIDGKYYVTIPEDGNFAFQFRLMGTFGDYGSIPVDEIWMQTFFMLALIDDVAKDATEVESLAKPRNDGASPLSLNFGMTIKEAKAGDKVEFRFSHYTVGCKPFTLWSYPNQLLPQRSTMFFWKL